MGISISQVIVWLIVGAIAGHLVGSLVTFKKGGLGRYTNIGLGLAGAIVGGGMFRLFKFDLGLKDISFSAEDIASAMIGAMLVFAGYGIWKFLRKKKTNHS